MQPLLLIFYIIVIKEAFYRVTIQVSEEMVNPVSTVVEHHHSHPLYVMRLLRIHQLQSLPVRSQVAKHWC